MTDYPLLRCPRCERSLPANASHFFRNKSKPGGLDGYCKVCRKAVRQARYQKDLAARDKRRIYQRKWFRENASRMRAANRDLRLRYRYNLTAEEYAHLLAQQSGRCAICGVAFSRGTSQERFSVDHDHSTGVIRGLLCRRCNRGLGFFGDEREVLLRAADYLHRRGRVVTDKVVGG